MSGSYKVVFGIGEGTVYADTVEDLAIVLNAVRDEQAGVILAHEHDLERKREQIAELERRIIVHQADLKERDETQVYGPQLKAEREAAIEARDYALKKLEDVETSRRDLDNTRRALGADNRQLTEERDMLLEEVKHLRAEVEQLRAKRKRGRKR